MVNADVDKRLNAVLQYTQKIKTAEQISTLYGINERTLRRWVIAFRQQGLKSLQPKSTTPKRVWNKKPKSLRARILRLKQRHPSWGARRIKHQYDLPLSWKTVHSIIKDSGLLIRIKAKPQPYKRFARYHVDSLWQGDSFQFRIHDVGKVYVTGFTDDCSRFRIVSKAYLHKCANESVNALSWALRRGRVPRQIYLDNGKQFIAGKFKEKAAEFDIDLVFGKPYHPRGRGKIESYHKTLYRDLICRIRFKSLAHFRRELWKFDRKYNFWRKQKIHGWRPPAAIYFDKRFFNKDRVLLKKRTKVFTTK